MIKKLAFFLTFPLFLIASQEVDLLEKKETTNHYNYFRSSGLGLYYDDEFLPGTNFGLGTRYRNKHMGYGFSVNLTYLGLNPYFSIRGESLYYFQESSDSYFAGISLEGGHHFEYQWRFLARGEIMLGKEFINRAEKKCFVCLGIDPFFLLIEENITPLVSINLGWGF